MGGSTSYDHTKRAVAFNTVQLVYRSKAVAARLAHLLDSRAEMLRARFPSLLVRAPGGPANATRLKAWLMDYLLETTREGDGIGCYTAVYPSAAHHAEFGAHLSRLRTASPLGYYDERLAVHELLHLLLDAAGDEGVPAGRRSSGGEGGAAPTTAVEDHAAAERADARSTAHVRMRWRPPYRKRCEQMLRRVEEFSTARGDRHGDFARRTHIFGTVGDLEE